MYEPIEPIEEMTPSEEDLEEYVDVQPQQDDLEEYIDVDPTQLEVSTGGRNSCLMSEYACLRGDCVH